MSRFLRVVSALAILGFVCSTVAFAGSSQSLPPGKQVALAGGKQAILNKQNVLIIFAGGKWATAPKGSYNLKNGNVVKVGLGGVVDPASLAKFGAPGTTVQKTGY
jgi:hypothetical protein